MPCGWVEQTSGIYTSQKGKMSKTVNILLLGYFWNYFITFKDHIYLYMEQNCKEYFSALFWSPLSGSLIYFKFKAVSGTNLS